MVGEANVRSQVNLSLDFTQIESTTEDFDNRDKGPRTRSEVLAEDRADRVDAVVEVEVLGLDVGKQREGRLAAFRRASIGFIFQGHNLIASQDAVGNVRLPLMLNGVGGGEATRASW
jgi:hypothetical protein